MNTRDINEKWVHAIKRKKTSHQLLYSYLCNKHFTLNDYQILPGIDTKLLLE